jgi:hypothetical protein
VPPVPDLQQIDSETWYLLLVPPGVLCAIAIVVRSWHWLHMVAFLAGAFCIAIAADYYDVYILGEMDEKFRHAPVVAFEIGLMGAGVFSSFRALVFVVSLAILGKVRQTKLSSRLWLLSLISGTLATLGTEVQYRFFGASYPLIAWMWMASFPVIYALFLVRPDTNKGLLAGILGRIRG